MTNEIMTAKTSHNENFGSIIEKLVQTEVTKYLTAYATELEKLSEIALSKAVLTVKDVAELLDMNERVIVQKINSGLIPAYKCKITNKFLVLKRELIKEIASGTQYKSISMISTEVNQGFDNRKYV
ncbi:helix-turn-helix domain-containing protein [Chryseobacterium sp. B21-037]|jgi:Fe-S cluster assembly ATPase SufC|uniref:helix-turn-helix domain-containing protein n=1 Tax=Chryseobacterium sp. B21-037 TaxID=2926038 RepID=UPI0023582031|nr:helix-turn-helix domain-containing protein [Chryseobacterium sp. B21-037]MDC8104776.1 helix-turn-helix domain-containing protein [Chryseobacterium sp. B21-037]